jgi:hypothetical protein
MFVVSHIFAFITFATSTIQNPASLMCCILFSLCVKLHCCKILMYFQFFILRNQLRSFILECEISLFSFLESRLKMKKEKKTKIMESEAIIDMMLKIGRMR